MSKRFKRNLYIFITLIIIFLFIFIIRFIIVQGVITPYMKINGSKNIEIEINESYYEQGIHIKDKFQNIDKNIQIYSNVNINKIGSYKVLYTYKNHQKYRIIEVKDTVAPILTLKNESHIILFQNDEYIEYGIEIYDNSKKNLSNNIKITNNIDMNTIGNYKVEYQVKDESNNESKIERVVEVVENPLNKSLYYHYEHIDNTKKSWWFKKANDHERKPSTYDENIMNQYNAYYIGKDEKVIYLTFDEGGNDKTYIKEISDILNNHNVQASYFLTRNYIYNEKEFMKELVNNGHEIGNHTRNHYDMTLLANEQDCKKFVFEIMETHKTIYEITKKIPPLIFRFPKGDFSRRALAMVNDLGFSTYFWSHAYNDYSEDVSKKEAYNNLITHLHPGAIYLLHPSNLGNYEAMSDFIIEAKSQGYSFDLVSNIKKD